MSLIEIQLKLMQHSQVRQRKENSSSTNQTREPDNDT